MSSIAPSLSVIDDIEDEDNAAGYEDRSTPDLYLSRATSAYECLLPTQPNATSTTRQQLCASCPLAGLCAEIAARETFSPAALSAPADAAPAPAVDELAARRSPGIRPALIWRAA